MKTKTKTVVTTTTAMATTTTRRRRRNSVRPAKYSLVVLKIPGSSGVKIYVHEGHASCYMYANTSANHHKRIFSRNLFLSLLLACSVYLDTHRNFGMPIKCRSRSIARPNIVYSITADIVFNRQRYIGMLKNRC
ncbi:hypothetical protein ALC53_09360 [Atta colombica]|uniref:Uncharacterized protein n=1 Tax=Atta colombica TaxID=520822 RepID=A0A195B6Z2_9HYME|nr:hypothetical protein ALC53_09360 [Atta colombica]